jgi:hypothetical protein
MVCFQISKEFEICVDYIYDSESIKFLGKYKVKFETYITRAIIKILKENKNLISAHKLSVLVDLNIKNSEFSCKNKTDKSFKIKLNPLKLSKEHENIVEYLKLGIPPSKWHVWKKFYGGGSTFNHFIEHEIRHYLDNEEKGLENAINNYINKKVSGTWILLLKFIDQVRSEAYPKLFDSSGKVKFNGNELEIIKNNLFNAVRKEELSEEYCLRYNQKPNWRDDFFVGLEAGNHIYTLARYMAYIIAYSMTGRTSINKAIKENLPMIQPSSEAKNKAGNLIRSSTPIEFIEIFDKAATKLRISERFLPLSRKNVLNLRLFIEEHEKKQVKHLIERWKHKEITFLDLKKEIHEMMGGD